MSLTEHPFMGNCRNQNHACAPSSTMTEIYKTEPCLNNVWWKECVCLFLALCVHSFSHEYTHSFMQTSGCSYPLPKLHYIIAEVCTVSARGSGQTTAETHSLSSPAQLPSNQTKPLSDGSEVQCYLNYELYCSFFFVFFSRDLYVFMFFFKGNF